MKILVVEDDHLQVEWIGQNLQKQFPAAQVEAIRTELAFREKLREIVARPPDIVIMDVMLRWTDPSSSVADAPEDVKKEGVYKAGLRCKKLLAEKGARQIPVLLYTVLERSDLPVKAEGGSPDCYLRKEGKIGELAEQVSRLTGAQRRIPPRDQ